ncbi:MAG: hypothetical protein Q4C86_03230 [bacterium]|nr:hypothetical protein [bacterium]
MIKWRYAALGAVLCLSFVTVLMAAALYADTGPAIRVEAPRRVRPGETFTARVVLDCRSRTPVSALAATLAWSPAELEAVGEPQPGARIYSPDGAARGVFDVLLRQKVFADKGALEFAVAGLNSPADITLEGKVVLMSQKFAVKGAKRGTSAISFVTDPSLSANGTMCLNMKGGVPFSIMTPATVVIEQ